MGIGWREDGLAGASKEAGVDAIIMDATLAGQTQGARMRKFWSVTGQLVEDLRYINVPMRWCEQYPAREARTLGVSGAGQNVKLIVHSREMPTRRSHKGGRRAHCADD